MKRMIKIVSTLTIAIALIVIAHISTAKAQEGEFTMPWSVISAGGGVISNNGYTITSTIGQPVAGRVSNGAWTLTSGFLSFLQPPLMPNEFFLPLFMQ